MSQLLNLEVPEPKLKKILDLARTGQRPSVEWSPSKADMDDQAFKKRGTVLDEIAKLAAEMLGPELLDSDPGNGKETK